MNWPRCACEFTAVLCSSNSVKYMYTQITGKRAYKCLNIKELCCIWKLMLKRTVNNQLRDPPESKCPLPWSSCPIWGVDKARGLLTPMILISEIRSGQGSRSAHSNDPHARYKEWTRLEVFPLPSSCPIWAVDMCTHGWICAHRGRYVHTGVDMCTQRWICAHRGDHVHTGLDMRSL